MPEGYTYSSFEDFDSSPLQNALSVESQPVRDVSHGEGEAFPLTEMTELQVYPDSGVARLTTENARVELFRVSGLTSHNSGKVVFEVSGFDEDTSLTVHRDATAVLRPVIRPAQGPDTAAAPSTPSVDSTAPRRREGATEQTQTPSGDATEAEDRPIITFAGQLGRDPWFKQDGDELVSGFPVAENHNGAPTVWHDVVTRGDLAKHIQDSLATTNRAAVIKSGQPVEITGHHEPKPGRTRAKPDLVATSVTRISRDEYNKRRLAPPQG